MILDYLSVPCEKMAGLLYGQSPALSVPRAWLALAFVLTNGCCEIRGGAKYWGVGEVRVGGGLYAAQGDGLVPSASLAPRVCKGGPGARAAGVRG